jgi:hypothetical protein
MDVRGVLRIEKLRLLDRLLHHRRRGIVLLGISRPSPTFSLPDNSLMLSSDQFDNLIHQFDLFLSILSDLEELLQCYLGLVSKALQKKSIDRLAKFQITF